MEDSKVSVVSESTASPAIQSMLSILEKCYKWADEIQPVEKPTRFGNAAFRIWHSRLEENSESLIRKVLLSTNNKNISLKHSEEISAYLCKSFGDAARIDYGSGHEAMFIVVLYSLWKIGIFSSSNDNEESDLKEIQSLVLLVFRRYLKVTRKLQIQYMLEPAGSHGVWGLDDYSFLPFLWGSSQLLSSNRILPTIINDNDMLKTYRDEYLYLDAILFIKEMKKGAFFEHSPMLNDISQVVGGWRKINQGMIKMYRGEVWDKRVVIQHFLFGQIFTFDDATQEDSGAN